MFLEPRRPLVLCFGRQGHAPSPAALTSAFGHAARLLLQVRRGRSSLLPSRPDPAAPWTPTLRRRQHKLLEPRATVRVDRAPPRRATGQPPTRSWAAPRPSHPLRDPPAGLPLRQPGPQPVLRFRSGVVRVRSTTFVCLLHGLVLLPSGISVAGADDTSAGDATELKWELDEDLVRCVVSFHVDQ
ncbi:hypothetical protein VPH35_117569 [Triticum aestivum]